MEYNLTFCGARPPLSRYSKQEDDAFFGPQYQKIAYDCLDKLHGFYYDICKNRCVNENTPMSLSHHPVLEEMIYGKIFPVLIFFVVVANLTVALVLSKKHMISSTNIVLKYMAIADLFVGLIPLPWTLFFFTMGHLHHADKLQLWWCYMAKYSMDAIPPVFHNIAMWLTVLLAGQRYISISYPLYSRQLCSVKNVRIATSVITFVSIVCGLPKFFDQDLSLYEGWMFRDGWQYTRTCLITSTPLVWLVGHNLFYSLYFWTRVILFILIPSFLLILLNALLIRGIQKAQQRKLRLLREKRSREAAKQTDSNSTSLMLVVIVSIFLFVNLPQAAFMAILCVCETFKLRIALFEGIFPLIFLLSCNMLVMVTYPINFGIYCFMSSTFRQTFKALFCKSTLITRTEVSQAYGLERDRTKSDATHLLLLGPDGPECFDNSLPASGKSSRGDTIFL